MLYNPSYKWTLPPLIPFITRVITHLLSGMNHQVVAFHVASGTHVGGSPEISPESRWFSDVQTSMSGGLSIKARLMTRRHFACQDIVIGRIRGLGHSEFSYSISCFLSSILVQKIKSPGEPCFVFFPIDQLLNLATQVSKMVQFWP